MSFAGSFGADESRLNASTQPFEDHIYLGHDSRLSSQRFNSFSNFDSDSVKDSAGDFSPMFGNQAPYGASDDGFTSYTADQNGGFGVSDGPILPPPSEMQTEEGFALREWRRINAIQLEEKEKEEKEMLQQIIKEAEEYKAEFYRKRMITSENNKKSNREKEKQFLANHAKFHEEAEKDYWRAIAELIPREVATIEKRGKKEKEKKPSVAVIQGPKPGKPTDLSRMRQTLLKLKHNTPPYMKPMPPPTAGTKKEVKTNTPAAASTISPPKASTATPEVLAAA